MKNLKRYSAIQTLLFSAINAVIWTTSAFAEGGGGGGGVGGNGASGPEPQTWLFLAVGAFSLTVIATLKGIARRRA